MARRGRQQPPNIGLAPAGYRVAAARSYEGSASLATTMGEALHYTANAADLRTGVDHGPAQRCDGTGPLEVRTQQILLDGTLPRRADSPTGSDMGYMTVCKARDGKYFSVGCAEPWLWTELCAIVGRQDLVPHQCDLTEKQKEIYEAFSEAFASRDRDAWIELLDKAGIGVAPVYEFDEMFADPHFVHRGVLAEVEHPKLGRIKVLNTPFRFSGTPAQVTVRPLLWAEHTREVLSSMLGYSEEDLDQLIREEVIE